MATNQIPQGAVPPKKTSPIVWIILGVVVFLFLGVTAVTITGYFIARRVVKNVGSNPAMAIAKIATMVNPDIEVVSADEARNIVVVKDKKTGKTFTMNFNDVKNGRIVMQEEGKGAVTMETGQSGVEVKSPEGTMKIGAGGKTPDWIPSYPGSNPEGTFAMQAEEGQSGSFHFTTKDPAEQVLKFYAEALGKAGMKATTNATMEGGKTTGGMVMGEDEAKKRTAMVTVGAEDGSTTVSVTFTSKK